MSKAPVTTIGIDAREIQSGVVTGIGRSLANVIRCFDQNDEGHGVILFAEKPVPLSTGRSVRQVVIRAGQRQLWDQFLLPRALMRHQVRLFYSPYYKVPLAARTPVVNQVLDLMYLMFPPYRSALTPWAKAYFALFGRACCRKAIDVITDSEHAKSDIVKRWRVPPRKISVIPLGVADRYRPVADPAVLAAVRRKLNLPDKYILYLGNFKPHKNVAALLRAFQAIAHRTTDCQLVLAGPLDADGLRIRRLAERAGIAHRVRFTGTITEADGPEAIYSMAALFAFPSLYEGFGLPPLEAMACGTPVVAAAATAVPEVLGDAAVWVNPNDARQFGDALLNLLQQQSLRQGYIQKGLQRAARFSEKQTAGQLYNHIMKLGERCR